MSVSAPRLYQFANPPHEEVFSIPLDRVTYVSYRDEEDHSYIRFHFDHGHAVTHEIDGRETFRKRAKILFDAGLLGESHGEPGFGFVVA